ncbi:mfs multidrug resistance [Stemphylium lycopersici]|nr:mfs multidrug resistance [Stemphylium lycopersici]
MACSEKTGSPPRLSDAEPNSDRGTDHETSMEKNAQENIEKGDIEGEGPRLGEESMSISSSRPSTAAESSTTIERPKTSHTKQRPADLSRTISVIPEAVIVPRSQRRGLLARFALIPEVENPEHYARRTKWFLTFIIAFCAMAGPMGSAIVMPVLQEISTAFQATETVTNMSVAVYMLSMAIFPLWWSSFSERLGRRTIYITSFILFVLFGILSAISTSIAMLIVFRVLSGGAAASVQAVGAGTIADIWETRERGRAMGIFYLGPLCGPLFAPIIGGALGASLGWRSTQWFLVIYGGATVIFIIFALPETLHRSENPSAGAISPVPAPNNNTDKEAVTALGRSTTHASTVQRTKSILVHLRRIFLDPLRIIAWLRFPPVLLTVYYASITFGCLYILNISLQKTFAAPPYRFSTFIIGLLYIPNSAGYLLASLFGGRWIDHIMHREARKAGRYDDRGKLIFRPLDRMKENAWIAAVLWPAALIAYGWTAEKGIHWIVPMISNFFFGIGKLKALCVLARLICQGDMMTRTRVHAGLPIARMWAQHCPRRKPQAHRNKRQRTATPAMTQILEITRSKDRKYGHEAVRYRATCSPSGSSELAECLSLIRDSGLIDHETAERKDNSTEINHGQ